MKKINVITKESPNFIGCWDLENDKLCNEIIDFFESNQSLQTKGLISGGQNQEIKKTTDISLNPSDLENPKLSFLKGYFDLLNKCFLEYKEHYPFLKEIIKKIHIGHFNIQKYNPGDHFSGAHSERTNLATLHRVFAWMTYLNDVEDGGTTNFNYYKVKIKPKKGKTLIWPSEWTHVHTGDVLNNGTKYIITGWMHFPS